MKTDSQNNHDNKRSPRITEGQQLITPVVLPDGNGGYAPCPELLTEEEAIRYLRLDIDGSADPVNTLTYYRNSRQLKAIKVGRKNRYRRQDLEKFLAWKSRENT